MTNTDAADVREIGIGVIGMGGFGLFAVQQFLQVPHTKLVAIAGSKREEAIAVAKRFGAEQLGSLEELVSHPDVDLVYIATPPFLHYEQSMLALNAGKHVICEKPLAMNPEQGDEMLALARQKGLLMVTNLMQRYNPMFARVKHLIDKNFLVSSCTAISRTTLVMKACRPNTGSGTGRNRAVFLSSTGFISSTCLPVGWATEK